MLDTNTALDYCVKLQSVLSDNNRFESTDKNVKPDESYLEVPRDYQESWNIDKSTIKEKLSRSVSHIHTCLTKRVELVQNLCKYLKPYKVPTFFGTPFDVSNVVKVLNSLAKSSKVSIILRYKRILVGIQKYFHRKIWVQTHQNCCLSLTIDTCELSRFDVKLFTLARLMTLVTNTSSSAQYTPSSIIECG